MPDVAQDGEPAEPGVRTRQMAQVRLGPVLLGGKRRAGAQDAALTRGWATHSVGHAPHSGVSWKDVAA